MKIFETIHTLLLFAFVIGVPITATTPPQQLFSLVQASKQAAIATAFILALLVINFFLARLFLRISKSRKDKIALDGGSS